MGVPKLKAKAERNYRRGLTWQDCSGCKHFVERFDNKLSRDRGRGLGNAGGRCKLIGLKSGRQYLILPHYLCDDFSARFVGGSYDG